MITEEKINNFKKELKTLLEKYNASISWECSEYSDTFAIYDQQIVGTMDGETFKICDGSSVSTEDLKFNKD